MAEIKDLSVTDASNNGSAANAGAAEGMAPSDVNNSMRALRGMLKRGFNDAVEGDKDSTGSSNAYAVAANRTIAAYYDGMRIGFHANHANTGAATLNVDSVGAKAIKKNHDVALASGDIEQHQYVEVVFSASDDAFQMISPVANAGSSYTDPLTTRGDIVKRGASATERLAIGSANTVLTTDGTDPAWSTISAAMIADEAINEARLQVSNSPTNGYFLSAQSGATGGMTWASGGKIVQVVNTQTGAVATGTTQTANDDTIPQNSEGNEWMTLAVTPTSSSNKLIIDVLCNCDASGDDHSVVLALFQDSTANALAAVHHEMGSGYQLNPVFLRHYMTAGTTSSTTFKVRGGTTNSGTVTFNGNGGSRVFGGVMASSITIWEIAA